MSVRSVKNCYYKILSKHLKLFRVIAAVIAFAMIPWVVFFVHAMLDYPLYYPFVKMKAEKYIAENYGAEGYVLESFKDYGGAYVAEAVKPGSLDCHFSVQYFSDGSFAYDTYRIAVSERLNVMNRLDKQYNDFVKTVLESPLFPFFPYSIKYTEQGLYFKTDRTNPRLDEGRIPADILVLDASYDIQELGETGGRLSIEICTDQLTPEFAAEALLKIDAFLKRGGVTYYFIDLKLRNPESEIGESNIYDLRSFRRSDIYEEGLLERVISSAEKT